MSTFPDLEIQWLKSNGATSSDRADAWREFLALQGFSGTVYPDAKGAWLSSLGYTGSTQDMLAQFWLACPL